MPAARPMWKRPTEAMVERLWPLIEKSWPARIDDLCEPADIPRATLYYYTPGMTPFAAWVVDEQLRRSAELVRDRVVGARSPTAALDDACAALLKQWSTAPHISVRLLDRSGTDDTAWRDLHALVERLVRAAAKDPRNAKPRATALIGSLIALAADGTPIRTATTVVRALH